ncbi:MAG: ABC transporter ATP-binding protein [Spirochaetaceae bacterium]
MDLINVKKISFSYIKDNTKYQIFKDFDLNLKRGSFTTILGPSGCGKSTLLGLLSGFKRPDTGEILFNGNKIDSPFPEGQVIFQDTGQLLPWLTVKKNIMFPRYRNSLLSKKNRLTESDFNLLNNLLESTGLLEYEEYHPNQLSGGLKQRVSLVRSIFAKSEIIFMDEPFVSLDAPSRFELQKLLLKLWKSQGKTVLFVTHDISEALLLSDQILIFSGDNKSIDLVDNKINRPRNRDDQEFIDEKLRIYSLIDSIGNSDTIGVTDTI